MKASRTGKASRKRRTTMEGSVTSGSGEGDEGVNATSLSPSPGQYQASQHAQVHPPKEPVINHSTQLYPSKDSYSNSTEVHPSDQPPVSNATQVHPKEPLITHCTVPSPTHGHPSHPANSEHPNIATESLPNDKHDKPISRHLSISKHSSKKSFKKSSKTKSTTTISRVSGAQPPTTETHQTSHKDPDETLGIKEASTSTNSSHLGDSITHQQSSPNDAALTSMPNVSPTHKASPTHRPGSSSSQFSPSKERHLRRFINANMSHGEENGEDVGTEGQKERMRLMMKSNGSQMQAIMEQEIQRLSRQKRDLVMRDRVVEPESWKRDVQKQIEEELEQRVREALETPPLERMRRNRHKARLKRIQKQQTSLSLEECDSYAQTLPSLKNNHHRWDLSETPYTFNDQQTRENRFSRLAHASHSKGNLGDSDTEDDEDDSINGVNKNQNHWKRRHTDNQKGNGAITQETITESGDSDPDRARTISEIRRKSYHQYTAEGFKAAIRKGKSHLKKIGSGKYVDKNGVVLTMDGPFWPPECGPLYPKPEHQNSTPEEKELLADAVHHDGRTVENQRTKWFRPFECTSLNVFDSERTSKGTIPHTVPDGCCPSLVFESRFESGNLRQARRVGQFEYELILKTDMYTPRHTQWFYFRVQRMLPGVTYKFSIINLLKKDSLYNHGMRPLMYSEQKAERSSLGWQRVGHNISYARTNGFHRNPLLHVEMAYYTLQWQLEFSYENDTCYFAHCYPYTFTDLREHIDLLLSDPERRRCTKREVLCESRAGNSCFLLTVTNFSDKAICTKRGIVVTARVHPGETNSSWMMKGLLDYITSSDSVAKDLRKAFIFKIVPMLNPDGVIVGNYRCSLTGRDLNRNFRHPKKESFPTVWHTKEMLEVFAKETEILVYCDLHGHSRKHNVFIYGCDKNGKEIDAAAFLYQRLFPWLMSREAPDKFSFRGCKFHVKRCKEATSRVVMWRELGISNSFTMEATFCGSKNISSEEIPRHFNLSDFEDLGRHFCEALLVYHKAQENKSLHSELILELTREITHQVLASRGLLPRCLQGDTKKDSEDTRVKDGSSGAQPTSAISDSTIDSPTAKQPSDAASKANKTPPSAGHDKPGQLVRSLEGRLETIRMIDALSSETIQGCIDILQDLHAMKDLAESDSSDSDSASESEIQPLPDEDKLEDKKKKKKKGKNRSRSMPDGKHHLKLALKAQTHQGFPITSQLPSSKSYQIYALQQDLNMGAIGPDVRPFRMPCHGKSRVSSYDDRLAQLYQKGGETGPMLYRFLEPKSIEMAAKASQQVYQEEQETSQGILPSIGLMYNAEDDPNGGECGTQTQMLKRTPAFVNRYIGRSNSGIPMFAQERLEERAIKRMDAMKKLEQERQSTALQMSEDSDYARLLALSKHIHLQEQDEAGYKLEASPTLTVHCSIPATPGSQFNVNFKQSYTHRNSALMKGPPLGLELRGEDPFEGERRHDNPQSASPRSASRKLQPMANAKPPTRSKDMSLDSGCHTYNVSQVHGAFVDSLNTDIRTGMLESDGYAQRQDVTNQNGDVMNSSGMLPNGDAVMGQGSQGMPLSHESGVAQIDMNKFGIMNGDSGHRSRQDHTRMQSATSYKVSNPWLGARNPVSRLPSNSASYNHAPLPARSPRNRQLSSMKKNHMDLIEQQYGRFLSGVDPKRAPSTAAKYLHSLAKSMKGGPVESTSQVKSGSRRLERK
ncbi:uncharacterized protein LOC117300677 isoform X2 [Asterias rubens]|uniref:uncharacterized protein LOC117300677 isoform X2 n=1 Tax=Asterias rubens TaxID=7604 RepID=UPI0014551618|nr:uncharacterized protein LOC117300677 isoform X2 [Asterias rubens]